MKVIAGLLAFVLVPVVAVEASSLEAETLAAWENYVAWTEHRMREPEGFLVLDTLPADRAEVAWQTLRSGEVFTTKLETTADGREIPIPDGMVHHWLGTVLIPGATVDELVRWLQAYDDHHRYFDDVEASKLISRNGNEFYIYLRLRRKKLVTVHYNTEHRVRYHRHGEGRVSSASTATHIGELADAGTVEEWEKTAGTDRGFLWRLNSYWRFQQTPDGVLVELESVSLSRSVPASLRWLAGSYLDSVPRESLEATLLPIQKKTGAPPDPEENRCQPFDRR